jgi:hypothetical protein
MTRDEIQECCDFFGAEPYDLPDFMMTFYRDATELHLIMDRLGKSFRGCPDAELRSRWTAISRSMTSLVVEIGIQRRAMLRAVAS